MKLRFISILLVFIIASLTATGQTYKNPPNRPYYDNRKWHFGFTLGPEYQNARIVNNSLNLLDDPSFEKPEPAYGDLIGAQYYSEVTKLSTGFHVGIITSRRLGEYFNLRMIPSLALGQKQVQSNMTITEELSAGSDTVYFDPGSTITTIVRSTYLSLPILLKYKAVRIENARPYMVAGVNLKYDLATDFDEPITLKKLDTSLEFGVGSDFYMQTFRLGIEVRFGIGLMNVLNPDRPDTDEMSYLTSSMDKIKAKTFTISINFE